MLSLKEMEEENKQLRNLSKRLTESEKKVVFANDRLKNTLIKI